MGSGFFGQIFLINKGLLCILFELCNYLFDYNNFFIYHVFEVARPSLVNIPGDQPAEGIKTLLFLRPPPMFTDPFAADFLLEKELNE